MTVGDHAPERAQAEPAQDFDLRHILPLLLRQKWTIAAVFVTVVAASVFITLSMPKVYEAAATLEYDPNPPRPLGSDVEDVATPVTSVTSGQEWYQTQNTIIASRTIALRAVDKLSLHRDPAFMEVPPEERARWQGASKEEAARKLLSQLSVRQERGTRVTRIGVQDGDPNRAAALANAIADAYMDWVMEERLGSTVRAVEWLSGQLDEVSKRLQASEYALHDFRRTNNVLSVSLADQQNSVTQKINSFGAALTEATQRRIRIEAKLRQLEAAAQHDVVDVHGGLLAESSVLAGLRGDYEAARAERQSLSTLYGPNHPEMLRVQAKIDSLVEAMRDEVKRIVETVRAEAREARDVEAGLRAARQQVQNEALDLNRHEIDYNRLERERANNEKLHGVLLQRTTETNLTRLLRVSPVRLVDRAMVATKPIRPNPVLNIGLGGVIGLLAGVGFVFARSRMDRSVSSPEELEALGATVLGLVPAIASESAVTYGAYARRRNKQAAAQGPNGASKDLIVHTHPHSSVAECCRTIRTNLAFMSTDTPLKSLVVTSPGPSEGKSTLAISLAITMAHSGRRVVLIDTDLRRPRIHRAFGLRGQCGITTVLAGEKTLAECLQQTVVDGLMVLPCGAIPPNPSELLHTARFERLLAQIEEEFDLAVLDSPPVGVVIDAAVVGPRVDGAVIVAKAGRTTRDAVAHTLRQMRDVGTNVLGCVLNDIDLSKQGAYGGYYYYYSGGYYASSDDDSSGRGDGGDAAANAPPVSPPVS